MIFPPKDLFLRPAAQTGPRAAHRASRPRPDPRLSSALPPAPKMAQRKSKPPAPSRGAPSERWQSGRLWRSRKPLCGKPYRGFESLPLRKTSSLNPSFAGVFVFRPGILHYLPGDFSIFVEKFPGWTIILNSCILYNCTCTLFNCLFATIIIKFSRSKPRANTIHLKICTLKFKG